MKTSPLLIEIGCEEIPARMIPKASAQFGEKILALLDQQGFAHGAVNSWGGSRRLAVLVEAVQERQEDREERVMGPPLKVGRGPGGELTKAAIGFASKQGIEPDKLETIETDRGSYLGFERSVAGKTLGDCLSGTFPAMVEKIFFPKTMRWGEGTHRWVRPVHWLLALQGTTLLPLRLFDIPGGKTSMGHRFLSSGATTVDRPEQYIERLEHAKVVVDPEKRRSIIEAALENGAKQAGGELIPDPELLKEVAELVEWPGVVRGEFPLSFLELPRELLVTTLRFHQKCFSIQSPEGDLMPGFLAVANTDRDPSGHIKRGNEWVVAGRLEDARYFWNEDRKQPLSARSSRLDGMVLHSEIGTYADKAERLQALAKSLSGQLGLDAEQSDCCREAAFLAKNDLLTGTVGEFPELQGVVGGLLLRAEGARETVAKAVYEHYRPEGPSDSTPDSTEGAIVAVSDKLDNLAEFVRIGKAPSGSRDPFGLRRAANGMFRIIIDGGWELSLADLQRMVGAGAELGDFLQERLQAYLKEIGFTVNEIRTVFRPKIEDLGVLERSLADLVSRLDAIKTVRSRDDFMTLVDLTKRVDNILSKNSEFVSNILAREETATHTEDKQAASDLAELITDCSRRIAEDSENRRYSEIVKQLALFIDPVERFFDLVLVLDPDDPQATRSRLELLSELRNVLTSYFDIRELAGDANRRN